MKKRQVVVHLLIPANQDAAKAIHPTMGPFYHPSSGFESRLAFERPRFFPPRPDMRGEAELAQCRSHFFIVVSGQVPESL